MENYCKLAHEAVNNHHKLVEKIRETKNEYR